MPRPMSRPLAVGLLVICTTLWGFTFVAQKTAMHTMGPLTFAGVRYLIGSLLVAPLAMLEFRRVSAEGVRVTSGQWLRIGILSVVFFIGVWLQQAALQTATATNGGFLTSLYVIFTPLVSYLLARTRPHPIVYLSAPLALFGIYLLTGARFDTFTVGDAELVACAVFWAIQVAMLGPLVRETGLPITVSALNFFLTGVLSLFGMLLLEQPSAAGIAAGWIELLYGSVFATAIAFTFQAIGQQYVPPANAAIILSAESLFAGLGGALLLGERLPPIGYAGAALIFVAIVTVEALPAWRARFAPAKATS